MVKDWSGKLHGHGLQKEGEQVSAIIRMFPFGSIGTGRGELHALVLVREKVARVSHRLATSGHPS